MNDAEARLAERLAADLERVLGVGIALQDVEIGGEGPVTIRVACLIDGYVRELEATEENVVLAMQAVVRRAAETRLAAAYWQMIGPA